MNKKGFTLIEILVSITLVSIVLVFMLNTLVRLKDTYNNSDKDTDIRVFGALISRCINSDFIKHYGINIINCYRESTDKHYCDIELNDGSKRKITLNVFRKDITSSSKKVISTVEYVDLISGDTILIKTISCKEYYDNGNLINSDEYYFNNIIYDTLDSGINVISIKASDKKYDIKLYSN